LSLIQLPLLAGRHRAPDFAPTFDIHRKRGYDPVELFVDPAIRSPPLPVGSRLLKRKLGSRTLLDAQGYAPGEGLGAHHRRTGPRPAGDLGAPDLLPDGPIDATAFKDLVLDHVFGC
jgi:hypothetical protein